MTVLVGRRESFNAAHQLYDPGLSDDENRRLFGKCANLHGHNYLLEVVVAGEIDQASGYVLDLKLLSEVINTQVIRDVDHRNLNTDVPWLKGCVPTTETPARACPEPAEAPAGAGAEPPGAPAGAPRELRNRYTAADLAVFTGDEASRFIPQGDGDPRGDMVLAWELLYRLEPGLYDRLASAERLHPGVVGWLPRH